MAFCQNRVNLMTNSTSAMEEIPKQEPMKLSQRRGKVRYQKIIETAQEILIKEGFTNMSLRNVAQRMGISHGNLTYYFANKEALLSAVIEAILQRTEEEFRAAEASFPDDPKARIAAFYKFAIEDAKSPGIENFFLQLWGLARESKVAAELRESVYRHFFAQVLLRLEQARPNEGSLYLKNKAIMIIALLEGMQVMYSLGEEYLGQFSYSDELLLQQLMDITYSSTK